MKETSKFQGNKVKMTVSNQTQLDLKQKHQTKPVSSLNVYF